MSLIGLMGGVTLLFYFAGILSGTATTTLLDIVLNPQNLQNASIITTIASISLLVISAVSTFVARNQNSDFYLIYPIVTIFLAFGWDFLAVYQAVSQTSELGRFIAAMAFGPFLLMYVVAVIEWWRGIEA